ncbi:putative poliovirus receptor-related protein 1-like [Triplophysa rosa]|uniref:Poliovirus receptor-related protein 1-like n=1 Tax=Triplophysa rosa TaxID=992332 RepID=A0A9W7WK51_TRIRA|nr:putative poliovirus receptor-related protein 1-like [Triplophysa rosa]
MPVMVIDCYPAGRDLVQRESAMRTKAVGGRKTPLGQNLRPVSGDSHEKPMAQGPPGGIFGIMGVVVVAGLIVGVVATICMIYRRGQKPRTETDNDLTDLPPAHKPAPPPPKKKSSDMKGDLTSDEIQVVHLDKEDEIQKIPLQPPYYDMAQSETTAFTDKPISAYIGMQPAFLSLLNSSIIKHTVKHILFTLSLSLSRKSQESQTPPEHTAPGVSHSLKTLI